MVLAISWKQQKALMTFICIVNCVNQQSKVYICDLVPTFCLGLIMGSQVQLVDLFDI